MNNTIPNTFEQICCYVLKCNDESFCKVRNVTVNGGSQQMLISVSPCISEIEVRPERITLGEQPLG